MSGIEDAVYENGVQIKIRLNVVIAKTILRFLHLGGVEKTIVWPEMKVGAFGLPRIIFDGFRLGLGLWLVSGNELAQKRINIGRILGHRVLKRIRSIIFEAHQPGFLRTQARYFNDDGKGVVSARTICAVNRGVVNALAQCPIFQARQDRLLRSIRNNNAVRCFAAAPLGIFLTLSDGSFTQAGKFFHVIDPNSRLIACLRKHIAKVLLEFCQLAIDLLHTRHLLLREQCTGVCKTLIDFFQKFFVLAFELVQLVIVDVFDTLEKLLVELNFVFKVGHHRNDGRFGLF